MDSHTATGPQHKPRTSSWHLHWQAAIGQTFVPTPALADRIRDRLVHAHQRKGRVLIDYTVLPKEIHLIARLSAGDSPGDVAGGIGNVVARWVREAGQVRSPVMGGPFRSFILESDDAIRHEARMLAWRPAFLRLCRSPAFYPHGALRTALGMRPAHGFDARPLLHLFGDSTVTARAALRRWIADPPSDIDWHAWELSRGLTLAPSHGGPMPGGFREVKNGEAAALVALAGHGGVEAALGLLADWVSWRIGRTGALDLHQDRNTLAARGRAIVARLAVEHAVCSAAFVARYFGKAKATLCEQMGASRLREADTRLVTTPMIRILEEIAALKQVQGGAPLVVAGANGHADAAHPWSGTSRRNRSR